MIMNNDMQCVSYQLGQPHTEEKQIKYNVIININIEQHFDVVQISYVQYDYRYSISDYSITYDVNHGGKNKVGQDCLDLITKQTSLLQSHLLRTAFDDEAQSLEQTCLQIDSPHIEDEDSYTMILTSSI